MLVFYKGAVSYNEIRDMPVSDFISLLIYRNKEVARENRELERDRE